MYRNGATSEPSREVGSNLCEFHFSEDLRQAFNDICRQQAHIAIAGNLVIGSGPQPKSVQQWNWQFQVRLLTRSGALLSKLLVRRRSLLPKACGRNGPDEL